MFIKYLTPLSQSIRLSVLCKGYVFLTINLLRLLWSMYKRIDLSFFIIRSIGVSQGDLLGLTWSIWRYSWSCLAISSSSVGLALQGFLNVGWVPCTRSILWCKFFWGGKPKGNSFGNTIENSNRVSWRSLALGVVTQK